MIFAIQEEYIKYFKQRLDACQDAVSYFALCEEIASFNENLYNVAVEEIALSSNPISLLVDGAEVEQIRKISDTHREISIRKRNAVVTWSDVIHYVRTHNKAKRVPQIDIPLANAEYLLINAYGANLLRTPIPRLYERSLKRIAEVDKEIKCFFSNSNTALKKQLNIIFDMISAKRNEGVGVVKAIERHSKLVHMELIKYSSLINNINIVDTDRLIDLILRQYINSLNRKRTSATSKLDVHKVQVPTFMQEPQALSYKVTKGGYYPVVKQSAQANPLFFSCLHSVGRKTYLGMDVDYTVEGIEKLLEENSLENSKRFWNTLIEYGEHGKNKFFACKHRSGGTAGVESYCDIAMFSPNGSAPIQECESTLIYHLRRNEWLPNKKGQLFRPGDITEDELHGDFEFSASNILMLALKIGENR